MRKLATSILIPFFVLTPILAEAGTFISIQKRDSVWDQGKIAYYVKRGDVLEIRKQSKCIHAPKKTCWFVKNTKTGRTGWVEAGEIKKKHKIFKK